MKVIKTLLLFFLLLPGYALAITLPGNDDVGKMACGLGSQLPPITTFMLAIAFVIGIFFVGAGLMKFKEEAQGAQAGSPNGPLKVAIIMILAGGLLTTVVTLSYLSGNTIFGTNKKISGDSYSSSTTAGDDTLVKFSKNSCN